MSWEISYHHLGMCITDTWGGSPEGGLFLSLVLKYIHIWRRNNFKVSLKFMGIRNEFKMRIIDQHEVLINLCLTLGCGKCQFVLVP